MPFDTSMLRLLRLARLLRLVSVQQSFYVKKHMAPGFQTPMVCHVCWPIAGSRSWFENAKHPKRTWVWYCWKPFMKFLFAQPVWTLFLYGALSLSWIGKSCLARPIESKHNINHQPIWFIWSCKCNFKTHGNPETTWTFGIFPASQEDILYEVTPKWYWEFPIVWRKSSLMNTWFL